jgi:sensor histidine kinase YesM
MQRSLNSILPSKYFVLGTLFFWMSVQAVYARIQFLAYSRTSEPQSWLDIWIHLSPWFFSWILVTLGTYISTRWVEQSGFKTRKQIAMHIVVMLSLLGAYWLMSSLGYLWLTHQATDLLISATQRQIIDTFHLDLLIYATLFFALKGVFIYDEHMQQKLQFKQLQHALVEEKLKTLRTQLNPHFIFNALNTVVSLIRLNRGNEAASALAEISNMLRKILENKNNDDVKIKDEVTFIHSYLAIQHLRFADKLDVSIDVAPNCLELSIPNMLLQPLVENAVQHGSQLESNMNPIRLQITRDEADLTVHLTNKVAVHDAQKGFGIGLGATKERLAKLYDNFKLEMRDLPDNAFETLLVIPINREAK